jgi:hypothetical protein
MPIAKSYRKVLLILSSNHSSIESTNDSYNPSSWGKHPSLGITTALGLSLWSVLYNILPIFNILSSYIDILASVSLVGYR